MEDKGEFEKKIKIKGTNALKLLDNDFAVLEKQEMYHVLARHNILDKFFNIYNYGVNHNATIAYIRRGNYDLILNNEKFALKEGDVVICPAGSLNNVNFGKLFSDKDLDYINIIISKDFIEKYLIPSSISPSFIAILKREALLVRALYKMDDYMNSLKDLYEKSKEDLTGLDKHLMIHSVIYIINKINEYLINKTYIRKSDRRDELINRLHDLFLENPTINYSIEQYSKRLYTSKYLLNKITKEIKGLTAKELINSWLIHEIKRDLLTSDLIVKEVAVKYGFSESTNFSKFFKRNEKMSVRDFYRKYENENL